MADRKAWHQLDPVKMSQKKFDSLPFRDEVKGEKYEEGQVYRSQTPGYENEVFTWHPHPKGAETKGEWRMGAADLD